MFEDMTNALALSEKNYLQQVNSKKYFMKMIFFALLERIQTQMGFIKALCMTIIIYEGYYINQVQHNIKVKDKLIKVQAKDDTLVIIV